MESISKAKEIRHDIVLGDIKFEFEGPFLEFSIKEYLNSIENQFLVFIHKKHESYSYEWRIHHSRPKDIASRLDEIEDLIKHRVAHKTDIEKSTKIILAKQREKINELTKFNKELLNILSKRSVSNIAIIFSLFGLFVATIFLLTSIFVTEIRFTTYDLFIPSISFILMLLISLLAKKIYDGKTF